MESIRITTTKSLPMKSFFIQKIKGKDEYHIMHCPLTLAEIDNDFSKVKESVIHEIQSDLIGLKDMLQVIQETIRRTEEGIAQ